MTITAYPEGGFMATGPASVRIVQALTIRRALMLYAQTGMKVNRAYTPTAMLNTASNITGKKYKRGQYLIAAAELMDWTEQQRNQTNADQGETK